jgi:hypothetical protein
MADSPFVMSDCSVSRPQVNELNRFREQQIKLRDSNVPLRFYNVDAVPPDVSVKIRDGEYGAAPIGMPAEFFAGQNMLEIVKATYPRENLTFEDKQDADIARTHAMDNNQAGVRNETARTATELQLTQQSSNVRLDKERAKVLAWYCKGVTKFSALVQRFLTVEQAALIVGPERAQAWAAVLPQVPAALAFTAAPDSSLRVDAASKRRIAMETYAYMRNDPALNAPLFLRESVLPALGLDSRMLAEPQAPPPPEPELPKVSVSVKGEDLNPLMPQYPGVLVLLKAAGLDVDQLPKPMTPTVPGPNPGVVQPDQGMLGAEDRTGQMQGTAFQAPIAPGGAGLERADD